MARCVAPQTWDELLQNESVAQGVRPVVNAELVTLQTIAERLEWLVPRLQCVSGIHLLFEDRAVLPEGQKSTIERAHLQTS